MATSNFTVAPSNASDASFRAWALAIHTALAALLTAVAQAGEIDFATVLTPSAVNQKRGFRIYRFNDAQQASHPVFIRVDYGSGSTTTFPGLWVQVGQAVDGSGNLSVPVTGTLLATQQLHTNKAGSATTYDCYASGNNGRITVCLWPLFHLITENPIAFNIERSKDSAGVETNEAVFADWQGGSTNNSKVFLKDGRNNSVGTDYFIPFDSGYTTATLGLQIACFCLMHYSTFKVFNAVTGFLIYASDDYDADAIATVTINIYGANHTYLPTGRGATLDQGVTNTHKLMVRND